MARKRKPNWRAWILLFVLLFLLIGGVVLMLVFRNNSTVESHDLPFSLSDSYAFSEHGVVYIQDQTLYFDDLGRGKSNWRKLLSAPGFRVAASESFIVVFNQNMVQTIDYEGKMLSKRLEFQSNVLEVRCGDKIFAVLRQNAEGAFETSLISRAGDQYELLTLPDYYVTDFGYYLDDQFWIMAMDTYTNVPVTRISTYSGADTKTGEITIDEEVVSSVYGTASNLYTAGTNTLRYYSSSRQLQESRSIYGWRVLDDVSDSNGHYFLLRSEASLNNPEQSGQGRLISLPSTGNDIDIRYPAGCIAAFIQNGYIVMLTSDTVYLYNMSGVLVSSEALGVKINQAKKVSKTRLLLGNAEESGPRCFWMAFGV